MSPHQWGQLVQAQPHRSVSAEGSEKKGMAKDTEMQELDRQKIEINDLLMDCITILCKSGDHEG